MGIADQPATEPTPDAMSGRALLLATFTAAITLSAALVFMVQPMFTKMVLPRFGGAPSVWSVAIVFFQAALLAGYAYAHWLTRYAGGRVSVALHLAVMIAAAFALPLLIAAGWDRPPAAAHALWLIGLFRPRSACRFLRSPPTVRCCRPGSRAQITLPPKTRTSSMPPAMLEASSRSCPIRS